VLSRAMVNPPILLQVVFVALIHRLAFLSHLFCDNRPLAFARSLGSGWEALNPGRALNAMPGLVRMCNVLDEKLTGR